MAIWLWKDRSKSFRLVHQYRIHFEGTVTAYKMPLET